MDIRALNLADDAEAASWYAAYAAGATAGRAAPLVQSEQAILTSLRTNDQNADFDRHAFGAWDGTACLGTALLGLPRKENTHLAEIGISVPVGFRRRGVGSALYAHTLGLAREAGRRLVNAELDVPAGEELETCDGGRFALARGFESKHTEWRLMLDVPVAEADLAALEASAEGALADGYSLAGWTGLPPEEHIAELAELMTLMERDVPIGELDLAPTVYRAERIEAQQRRWLAGGYGILTALVLDPDGAAVAYSTLLPAVGTADAIQMDTFVARAHRGRRLSTLVKAANLRRLAKEFPDIRYIHTGTADVNDAMRGVNDKFGFRPVERMHELEAPISG